MLELLMTTRHFFGDLALAVLLAIPVSAIAATSHAVHDVNPAPTSRIAKITQSPVENRFSLFAPN
jgi:hypothetical protein